MSEQNATPSKLQVSVPMFVIILLTLTGIVAMITMALNKQNDAPTQSDDNAVVNVDASAQSDGVKQVNPPTRIDDFTMLNTAGEPTPFSSFQGKWTLLYFGYTYCPDFCPTTMLDFRQIKTKLETDTVQYMLISVDYDRDTPEHLAAYLNHFDPTFIGLTGDGVDDAVKSFNVFYEKRANPNSTQYTVDHTASSFLVNPRGELVTVYAYSTAVDTIVADLKTKLAEN